MALVEHIRQVVGGRARRLIAAQLGPSQLSVDQKQLVRISAADDQVIVGVLTFAEMEAAQTLFVQQESDDLLDVQALRMVPKIDQYLRLRAKLEAEGVGRAPIRQVGAVKGRLEKLVLDQHARALRQMLVDQLQPLLEAPLASAQAVLAGVVGAVGEPQAQVFAL